MNNAIEKELRFRMSQTVFGHDGGEADIETFFRNTYTRGSSKRTRYERLIDAHLACSLERILEIGAGAGDFSIFCKKKYPQHEYYVSELSQPLLTRNIVKAAKFFDTSLAGMHTHSFPAEKIPFPNEFFDQIYIRAAVHHFDDPHQAFREIHRSLKRGGIVLFINDPVVLNIPLYKQFTKLFFCRKERARGENENIYTLGEYFSFGASFASRRFSVDEFYKEDFRSGVQKWHGPKKYIGIFVSRTSWLLDRYLIYRWRAAGIFEFTK
ncbi:MAG: methyltransferase domain-containing protein [Candidatus Paceibacterota bacterium]|jgi:ubiquinone/menaquinone biosynthesis C-methylase UbiE